MEKLSFFLFSKKFQINNKYSFKKPGKIPFCNRGNLEKLENSKRVKAWQPLERKNGVNILIVYYTKHFDSKKKQVASSFFHTMKQNTIGPIILLFLSFVFPRIFFFCHHTRINWKERTVIVEQKVQSNTFFYIEERILSPTQGGTKDGRGRGFLLFKLFFFNFSNFYENGFGIFSKYL